MKLNNNVFSVCDDGSLVFNGYLTGLKCGVYAYLSAPADTTVTTSGTYDTINGSFTNSPMENFSLVLSPIIGIRYDGTLTQHFEIDWYSTLTSSTNNCIVSCAIWKNGDLISGSIMSQTIKLAGSLYTISGTCVVELAQNDVISLVVTSDHDEEVVTFNKYTTTIREFFD